MANSFRIPAHEIKQMISGMGSCIASDRITVDGERIGFMYREAPDDDVDSGWRFFSGDESQAYLDDPEHLAIYDVNSIANYDSTIVAFLDSPVMSAFERDAATGRLRSASFPGSGLN